ncbi:MAG TPA: hypothetical protein VJG90_01710 [Candidatus Nanoarchaeia archaeon]|nr:hypothetical protein [Candidatus Nanoarchaeia archaeon]
MNPNEAYKTPPASGGADDLFRSFQDEKILSLKELIEDIQGLIEERKKLQEELVAEMGKMQMSISNLLGQADISADEKVKLKTKQIELDEKKIQEKLNSWKDIAALKQELRDHAREFKEKESRMEMLDEMMGTK